MMLTETVCNAKDNWRRSLGVTDEQQAAFERGIGQMFDQWSADMEASRREPAAPASPPVQYSADISTASIPGLVVRLRELGPANPEGAALAASLASFLERNPAIKADVPLDDLAVIGAWAK